MDLAAIYIVWLRDLKVNLRDRAQLIGAVVRSILWLVVLGLGLRAAFRSVGGVTFSQYIFPGIISMTILFAGVQSAISIVWEREFGFVRELLVAPIPRSSITIGKLLSGATLAMGQGAIVMALAPVVGVKLTLLGAVEALLLMFLLSITLTAVGIVIASRLVTFQGFGVIVNLFIMPMFFFSGAIFPLPWLPEWLKRVVMVNPLTYGVDALRAATIGLWDFSLPFDIALMVAFAVVLTAAAMLLFVKEI